MQNNPDQFQWVEKYRPHTVAECILPKELKAMFQAFVDKGDIPNFLFVGPKGAGKTSVAKAMLDEIGVDYIFINATLKGNIDTLRTDIQSFASSVSFKGKRKFVILDEADYLTYVTQPALRNFMEAYSENCGFILTANHQNKIIPEIQSRCPPINFVISKEEAPNLASQFLTRFIEILNNEHIKFEKSSVAALIKKHFPDWRRVLNELQRYSATGTIDNGILTNPKASSIKELLGFMKDKNFTKVRQWAADNIGTLDDTVFYQEFYVTANDYFKISYIPQLVLLLAKYDFQSNFVFSKEINFVAFCTECMVEAEWK